MLHELPMKNTLSCVQPIRAQNTDTTASLPTNHVRAERLGSVSCSCFASVFFFFPPSSSFSFTLLLMQKRIAFKLQHPDRFEAELNPSSSSAQRRPACQPACFGGRSWQYNFSQIGTVFRRHRAKGRSRSQASEAGRWEGRRLLGVGMESGEGAGGPGGPDGPGLEFGCASFNQDST